MLSNSALDDVAVNTLVKRAEDRKFSRKRTNGCDAMVDAEYIIMQAQRCNAANKCARMNRELFDIPYTGVSRRLHGPADSLR